MPATLLAVVGALEWTPAWIDRRGGSGVVFRAGAAALLAVVVLTHLQVTRTWLAAKRFPVGEGADRLLADARGPFVERALVALRTMVGPDDTIAAVPEGAMLGYLLRRPT